MSFWSKQGKKPQREKQTLEQPTFTTPSTETKDKDMSRANTTLSHGGPVPAAPTSTANTSDSRTPSRRRGGTHGSSKASQKQRRRRQPSQDSYGSSSDSSVFTIDRNPGRLLTIEPVSPLGSDLETPIPKKKNRTKKQKHAVPRTSSVENITALPTSRALKTSPHLRPATKDNADIPYDFRQALYPNSRTGTPTPLQQFQAADQNAATSPKKRNVLSRTGSDRKTKPPHLAALPLKLSKKSSKRQPPLRDEDIRVMTAPAMRPYSTSPYDQGILERDNHKVREGLNKRFARPQSTISLPRPDMSTRPSTRMSSLAGRPDSAAAAPIGSRSYRISVLDVLSPRPLIKVQEHASPKIWGEDDFENNPPMSPDTGLTKLTLGTNYGRIKVRSTTKRVDHLADDLDASELRLAMDRDKKRKEKKKEREAEKLKRRLERRAEKERAKEDGGDEVEKGEGADELTVTEKPTRRSKKSKKAGKEPIVSKDREVDEKSLPPEPQPPPVPPKKTLPLDLEHEEKASSPIPSLPVFRKDPDDEEHLAETKELATAEPQYHEVEDESRHSSPIEPMFPLQALPPLSDRHDAERGTGEARTPNMSLGPLLASSAAASGMVGLGGGSSMTALPQVPSPKKSKRRGSIIMGLFRRAAGKDQPQEDKSEKEKEKQRDSRRSRAKSLIGALAGKKSPETERDFQHDTVSPSELLASSTHGASVVNASTSGSIGRMFTKRSRAVTSTSNKRIPPTPPPKLPTTLPPRLVNLSREAVDSGLRPPLTSSSSKSPTLLRTTSIFKEQLSDTNLADEEKTTPLSGPYSVLSPAGDGQLFLRSPTPPSLSLEPEASASQPASEFLLQRRKLDSPFDVDVPAGEEGKDAEGSPSQTKELAEIGSEGSWLTGKPVKRRPSTRGSARASHRRTSHSQRRGSGSSSRYSDPQHDTVTKQPSFTLPLPKFTHLTVAGSSVGHETDDNASQSAYFDAESKRNPSTHAGDSEGEGEPGSPDPDDTMTPRPRSPLKSWLLSGSSGNGHEDDDATPKKEYGEVKLYGQNLGRTPIVEKGVQIKSSEGLLKEMGLGSKSSSPLPSVSRE